MHHDVAEERADERDIGRDAIGDPDLYPFARGVTARHRDRESPSIERGRVLGGRPGGRRTGVDRGGTSRLAGNVSEQHTVVDDDAHLHDREDGHDEDREREGKLDDSLSPIPAAPRQVTRLMTLSITAFSS